MLDLLHFKDKITVLNPNGRIAILTLWSRVDVTMTKLGPLPDCVAAISNFYGDGLSELLANLLWNPQISQVFVCGNNRTGSLEELLAYFAKGIEEVTINGAKQKRVKGTTRLINLALDGPELFLDSPPAITVVADLTGLKRLLDEADRLSREQSQSCLLWQRKALKIELLEPKTETFPSILAGHQIVVETPLDAWTEALFVVDRFGMTTQLAKGSRKELLNLKVVIQRPNWQQPEEYERVNLDIGRLTAYADEMRNSALATDQSYSYGHRLGTFFGLDAIQAAIDRLRADPNDRKAFLSLWDTRTDLVSETGHPCLVTIFFRLLDGILHLTATFRTHRAYTAYVENLHGLMGIQATVARALDVGIGMITTLSHSISIDPMLLDQARSVIGVRKWQMRDDGRGEFVFRVEEGKAVVEHKQAGLLLKRYSSSNIESLSHQLAQDYAASDTNHLLYLGRMLGKLQMAIKHGLPFEES